MIGKWVISFEQPTNKYLTLQEKGLTYYPEAALQFASLGAALNYLEENREKIDALGHGARPGRVRD